MAAIGNELARSGDLQRGVVDAQATGAEVARGRDGKRSAALDQGAAGVAIGAGEDLRAGTGLDQADLACAVANCAAERPAPVLQGQFDIDVAYFCPVMRHQCPNVLTEYVCNGLLINELWKNMTCFDLKSETRFPPAGSQKIVQPKAMIQ